MNCLDWRGTTITRHTEVPVDKAFASGAKISWLGPNEAPDKLIQPRPTHFPSKWTPSYAQPVIGPAYNEPKYSPWFYGQAPDLQRLVGNAVPGFGA